MLAIIPARGGSKGLPGKNIKPLLGKPLIAYTIEAALRCSVISRVVVSTDDRAIAEIALANGAEVPFMRPAELASDNAKAIDTYLHAVGHLENTENTLIGNVCVLLPTCPLRDHADIDAAGSIFLSKNADSVVSYTKEHHPIFWHKLIDAEGKLADIFPDDQLLNRQELKETYFPNGAIYFFKTDVLKQRKYYTQNSYAYVMPRAKSVDIDTAEDFELAEFYLKKRNEK